MSGQHTLSIDRLTVCMTSKLCAYYDVNKEQSQSRDARRPFSPCVGDYPNELAEIIERISFSHWGDPRPNPPSDFVKLRAA